MTPYVTTVEGTVIYITIVISYSLIASGVNMTAITHKMAKAQLIKLVEELLGEKAAIQRENAELKASAEADNKLAQETTGCANWRLAYHMCAQELALGKTKTEKTKASNIMAVPEEKVLATMKWLCVYLGYGEMPEEALVGTFEAYTNAERSWLGVYPKKPLAATDRFVKDLNQARFAKGIRGDYWKSWGLWVEVKR